MHLSANSSIDLEQQDNFSIIASRVLLAWKETKSKKMLLIDLLTWRIYRNQFGPFWVITVTKRQTTETYMHNYRQLFLLVIPIETYTSSTANFSIYDLTPLVLRIWNIHTFLILTHLKGIKGYIRFKAPTSHTIRWTIM